MALLYERAGRLTTLFGGFRPGQLMELVDRLLADGAPALTGRLLELCEVCWRMY
jgi:hypothetical protein